MFARISDNGKEQGLIDHLEGVAAKTRDKLPHFLKEVGYYAGLLHDLGKAKKSWQKYLLEGGEKIFHSFEGARVAIELSGNDSHPIAHVIRSHHGSLKDENDLINDTFFEKSKHWETCLNRLFPNLVELPDLVVQDIFKHELAIRMLFSALVDSDRMDAQIFELKSQNPHYIEGSVQSEFNLCFNSQLNYFEQNNPIVKVRNQFHDSVCKYIINDKGMYRLIGATGIGKTLTSLEYAVEHGKYHNMDGIVYVAPYKSILDQSAEVYRRCLGDDVILEHHSDFVPEPKEERNYKLSCERWDKPVILTTSVQFYESIFSNKASKCRKLSSLINRVILIDEFHTAPPEFISPITNVLQNLVEDYGCTILFMSATAPNLKSFGLNAVDMIPLEELQQQFKALSRCQYEFMDMNWEAIASYPNKKLVIVNTTGTAKEAFNIFNTLQPNQWLHLSSRMCVAHRKETIKKLKTGQFNCISTQIIEAGIDIDHPVVFSEECPLDSLIQRGGRCNREGLLPIGNVFIIPGDRFPDQIYKQLANYTTALIQSHGISAENIIELLSRFFAQKFKETAVNKIQRLRNDLKFKTVAEEFKIIDNQESVVCRWGDGAKLIDSLMTKGELSSQNWKQLQRYIATVPQQEEYKKFIISCENGMKIWGSNYDDNMGLCLPDSI